MIVSEEKKSTIKSIDKTTEVSDKSASPLPIKSKGEKLYNWTVYSGINYWLNLGLSLVIADFFLHDPTKAKNVGEVIAKPALGVRLLNNTIEGFANLLNKCGLELEKAKTYSGNSLKALSLMSGGWILLIPMKYMEDYKRPIVFWLNKHLYHAKQTAPDGHQLTSNEIYLEKEQPAPNWWNVFKRRIYATIAVSAVAGPLVGKIFGSQDIATGHIMKQVNKGLNSGFVPGGKWLANNPRSQRYLRYAALDTFFTLITAVVMRVTNGAQKEAVARPPKKGQQETVIDKETKTSTTVTERTFAKDAGIKPSEKRKTMMAEGPKNFREHAETKAGPAVVAP